MILGEGIKFTAFIGKEISTMDMKITYNMKPFYSKILHMFALINNNKNILQDTLFTFPMQVDKLPLICRLDL
jgi:hypothetical protein